MPTKTPFLLTIMFLYLILNPLTIKAMNPSLEKAETSARIHLKADLGLGIFKEEKGEKVSSSYLQRKIETVQREKKDRPGGPDSLPFRETEENSDSKRSYSSVVSLTEALIENLEPGIYESDDIALILSVAKKNFTGGESDVVIFDVDQVLITARANPFVLNSQKKSAAYEKISGGKKHIKDKFLLYLSVSESPHNIVLMDQRTPILIRELQSEGVRCLGNTALDAVLGTTNNFDVARARVKLLRDLGIDFSETFPSFFEWNFDSLDKSYIKNCPPLFRDGIIFSSLVPKHTTQIHFLQKLGHVVKRVMFIDDNVDHLRGMYKAMREIGIQCYCVCYTKKKTTALIEYFLPEFLEEEFVHLESVLEKLLQGECTDELFLSAYLRKFIIHLRIEDGWRLWK